MRRSDRAVEMSRWRESPVPRCGGGVWDTAPAQRSSGSLGASDRAHRELVRLFLAAPGSFGGRYLPESQGLKLKVRQRPCVASRTLISRYPEPGPGIAPADHDNEGIGASVSVPSYDGMQHAEQRLQDESLGSVGSCLAETIYGNWAQKFDDGSLCQQKDITTKGSLSSIVRMTSLLSISGVSGAGS